MSTSRKPSGVSARFIILERLLGSDVFSFFFNFFLWRVFTFIADFDSTTGSVLPDELVGSVCSCMSFPVSTVAFCDCELVLAIAITASSIASLVTLDSVSTFAFLDLLQLPQYQVVFCSSYFPYFSTIIQNI